MMESNIVSKISFTGSTNVGKTLIKQSADTVKKISMELGGNASFIVFSDANIDLAVDSLISCKFRNCGQTCVCANRIFIHSDIHNIFVEKLKLKISKLVIGNGLDKNVSIGPLIDDKAVQKIKKQLKTSLEQGAKLIFGGEKSDLGDNFFQPTILTNVLNNSIFWQEETFGPIVPIAKFNSEYEVIAMANNTHYGLATYFFTSDYKRVHRVNRLLKAGIIGINTGVISNEFGPFGGVKQSGIGREGSVLGIEDYLEIKYSLISYN